MTPTLPADVTRALDVFQDPPTGTAIAGMRGRLGTVDDAFLGVFMVVPLPIVDVVAGAAAAGVDHLWNDRARRGLEDVPGALDRDWSASRFGAAYVDKVRVMGRPLVASEVAMLEDHARVATAAAALAGAASSAMADGLAGALGLPRP